jgi:hypothetical protein
MELIDDRWLLLGIPLQKEPAERPRSSGHADADDGHQDDEEDALPQVWRRSGESCPEGTIPVRRTTEADVLRASSVSRFGMKARGGRFTRRDSTAGGHEVSHLVTNRAAGMVIAAGRRSPLHQFLLSFFLVARKPRTTPSISTCTLCTFHPVKYLCTAFASLRERKRERKVGGRNGTNNCRIIRCLIPSRLTWV